MAFLLASCDTPQKVAFRNLAHFGIEASGRSLVKAVRDRNAKLAGWLLEARVYTEQRDSQGLTPLGIAVRNRDMESVIMLLNGGANVNASLANRTCVLGIAAEHGDESIINVLLAAGAQTDGWMPDGERILPWAIRRGRLGLVRSMMKADSDPHLKDRNGNPLLHIAMESGRRDLMDCLIELGADPAATNASRETTIHLALRQGWSDIVPRLAAAGADPNQSGRDGHTLLEEAVRAGNLENTLLLLQIGADPNHRGRGEETATPLEKAFQKPSPMLFEVFLKHGAKPAAGGWDSWLWRAFHHRDLAKARLLLAHGAWADSTDSGNQFLLESAAAAGEGDFVKLLLDYGAPAGQALYAAAARGDYDIVSLLIACGASPDSTRFPIKDHALAAAIRGGHDRVAELLVEAGADFRPILPEGQRAFHLAVAKGCYRTVRQLLVSGADPNAPFLLPVSPEFLRHVRPGVMRWVLKMDRNATPLMVAADSGNIQIARYLMRAGAKINIRTRASALWPINFASRRSDVKMMRLFLGKDPYREERQIEVRLSEQRARVYDGEGKEVFTTKVSTGRPGFATPTGEFVITNKHRDWKSTLYHASMPYFQRFSCGDFGLHQGKVPGYPASHGCIRVPAENAAKLFAMTQTGDRVRILP